MNNDLIMEMTKEYAPADRNAKLKGIMGKWSKTGLLANLKEDKAQVVAQLLENQAVEARKQIMTEESSTTPNLAGYNKIAFPLVRRVFGQLLATELVSVQPMSLPSGLLFFLDFHFDRNSGGATAGGSVYGTRDNAGPNNNEQLDAVGADAASGGFYNFAGIGYSRRNFLLSNTAPTYSGVTATSEMLGGVTVSGYDFALIASGSTDLAAVSQIRLATSGEATAGEMPETFRSLRAIKNLSATTRFGGMDPTLTSLTAAKIQIFGTWHGTGAMPTTGPDVAWLNTTTTAAVLVGPARTSVSVDNGTNNLGDFESTSAIPEVNIAVSSVPVQAVTRKLKATWTPELAQDINAYHSVDAEVELTTILSDIISTEIDREILSALLQGASVRAAWSRMPGRYVTLNAAGNTVATYAPVGTPTGVSTNMGFTGTSQDWYQTFAETLLTVSNEIHKRNLRSGANWLVTSPDVATVIEAIAYFKPNATFDPTEVQYSMGIEKVGTLSNRFTVYKDPYFPVDHVLLGYKGPGFLDAGYVYAPYVPLVFTPTIFEPNDFTPRKGAMTRYAHQMVRPSYYGNIRVVDLGVIGSPASV